MAQTIADLEARLAKIDTAIDAALTGRKYKIGSGGSERELERQSLKDLQAMRQLVETQINRLGGGTIRHVVPTP